MRESGTWVALLFLGGAAGRGGLNHHPPPCYLLLSLLIIISSFAAAAATTLNYTKSREVSSLRLQRIQRHLNRINKTPLMSIQSPDGDIIDCIHKRNQPALDHPLLKNHKIQKAPSEWPTRHREEDDEDDEKRVVLGNNTSSSSSGGEAWQAWHETLERCPGGSIPVRRSSANDVLRAKSLYHFGKKRRGGLPPLPRRTTDDDGDAPGGAAASGGTNGHEHAIAYTSSWREIYGAKATINVWDPAVQVVSEFSLSQIWLLSGSFDGSDLNSIEAGWQVSPELYGDNRPRLFIYWTTDSYQATGCYNLLCSGFVQTNSRIAIGAAISPVSSSAQYDITILIWKDPKLGHWWMGFGDNTLVGYWPADLFTHLADRATMVEWGGEIVNSRPNGGHTSTQMGSGRFAEEGFGKASYFRNLEIVDSDNSLAPALDISTLAENTNCYNIQSSSSNEWGAYFYYGGPGKNRNCP